MERVRQPWFYRRSEKSNIGIQTLVFIFAIVLHTQAMARSQFGIAFAVGESSFHGNFSSTPSALNYEIQFQTLFFESSFLSIEGFLSIEAMFLQVDLQPSGGFHFSANEKTKVNTFLFAPTVCNSGVFQVCLGLGQGTVNVNQAQTRRDYGTWNYRALLRYKVMEGLRIFVQGKYVGEVEIEDGALASDFSVLPISTGLVYRF